MTTNKIINWQDSELNQEFFPIIVFDKNKGMFESSFYKTLKNTFPKFSEFKTTDNNQKYRRNIELRKNGTSQHKHNLTIIKTKYPAYYELFTYLTGDDFKRHIFDKFNNELMKSYGFKGDINKYDVLLQICESTGGYENPFHVDSRKRIVHGLLYFGKDEIISGGEFCIGKHTKLDDFKKYTQYPNLNDLNEIKTFQPDDNFGVFVLSTPDSYHKGNITQGKRRFMYISIDYTGTDKIAWDCGWAKHTKPFVEGLKSQQKDDRYKKVQKEISERK